MVWESGYVGMRIGFGTLCSKIIELIMLCSYALELHYYALCSHFIYAHWLKAKCYFSKIIKSISLNPNSKGSNWSYMWNPWRIYYNSVVCIAKTSPGPVYKHNASCASCVHAEVCHKAVTVTDRQVWLMYVILYGFMCMHTQFFTILWCQEFETCYLIQRVWAKLSFPGMMHVINSIL